MNLVGIKRSFAILPRKLLAYCGVIILLVFFLFLLFHLINANTTCYNHFKIKLVDQNLKIDYLKSLIRAQDDYIDSFKREKLQLSNVTRPMQDIYLTGNLTESSAKLHFEVAALLKNISGTRTADGFHREETHSYYPFYLNQVMPHLSRQPRSFKPAFLISAGRRFVDVVIGVPTVKRDAESYLMVALKSLVENLSEEEANSTLIIVSIGETDASFILKTALEIETMFGTQLDSGLIDVIAPAPSYYPNFEMIPTTLGDSGIRHQWRTKQNLDVIFTMAYAHNKGRFYLMLEDDVIPCHGYISIIMTEIRKLSVLYPSWILIRFGKNISGFGNLLRSSNLVHLISYLQLFYANMPIDYLLQGYVDNLVCTPFMRTEHCKTQRQRASISDFDIFEHIGTYSSLSGKMHKVKKIMDDQRLFFPHDNPPVSQITCTIDSSFNHTIDDAYNGLNFFWGRPPNVNDVIRFEFKVPALVKSFKFRTGNALYTSDTLHYATVEIKKARNDTESKFIPITYFDEFGIAESTLVRTVGYLEALQIRILRASNKLTVISEIKIEKYSDR